MARKRLSFLLVAACGALTPFASLHSAEVSFSRDVRPILSDTCFHCHGPDKAKRKGGLRLDTEEGLRSVVQPGNPAESELFRRLTAHDVSEQMPPRNSGRSLTSAQVDTLKRWIAAGASWQKHWSFVPPERPSLPTVKQSSWVRNAIDRFVLARLEQAGLTPSPEADPTTLLRRVTLDLTGLPPSPREVDAFLADPSPAAYEKVVDRLLASPRLGERLAARWLDAARYADTNGYQTDGERHMSRWRDWVIDAFNSNKPFDQFTVEQLAGDLIPGATTDQRIATGFNRNHRGNSEGGIIPEEYQVEYVVDRVETTGTVWLGLTLGCARCHEHKFDPVTQKEFYGLFAYFNNVPEHGRALKYGNSPPYVRAPTRDQRERLAALGTELRAAVQRQRDLEPARLNAQRAWERRAEGDWQPSRGLVARVDAPSTLDGRRVMELDGVGDFGFYDAFTLSNRLAFEKGHANGTILSRMTDVERGDGYGVQMEDGRLLVHLTKRWLDDALRVRTVRRLEPGRLHHVAVTYDGSRVAAGVKVYVDGHLEKVEVLVDELNQSFATREPLRIGGGGGPTGRFRGRIEAVRVYDRVLDADEVAAVSVPESVGDLARATASRTPTQIQKLQLCFLDRHAPTEIREAHERVAELERQRRTLLESFPTVMVMEDIPGLRATRLLVRGQYDRPGPAVEPGLPVHLGSLSQEMPQNRLGLARWLVSSANPLTARVTVNRWWQALFGVGLVRTVDDFGLQGEWPSHPDLIDWLAVELVRSGWDLKAIHRQIVLSATYRQSSRLTPELWQRDPENRLLARGPRYRLPAEMIRDQALAASGLMAERLGGPSVKPYQPAGLWKELTGTEEYIPDKGEALYRRSLYTFWKRTVAPPTLVTFDAAGRETCVVREARTNTPLQALNLMNDVTFVEAARVLAQRVLREENIPEARITLAFRSLTGRRPRPEELRVFVEGLAHHRRRYERDPGAARKLVEIGEAPVDLRLDPIDLAAYTVLAGVILNLDEVITKE